MNNENFDLELNNDVENFNLTPNDEDEEFTVEFGEIFNDGGTHDYDELDNKPQVNGVTLEGNKTLSELGIPVYRAGNNITISGDNTISAVDTKYTAGNGLKLSGTTFSADTGVLATKTELSSKQDKINDLPAIREGATAGATAVQPGDLATVAMSGSYNDLANKPTIPIVNNAALTIQKNGSTITTFTANSASNQTANITVPTTAADVSALPNTTKYGASLSLSMDSGTYVLTAVLKDQNGNNLGASQTIDLPLESVVVGGEYDSANKKVILTLQGGDTIEFSVADLVAGLQSEITSDNKLSSDLVDDSNAANKFVTSSEKTTWSGKQDTLIAGTNITIASDGKTISATDTTYSNATTTAAGLMSATDKVKTNSISGYYGTCSTGASTSAKIVACDNFVLDDGAVIFVKFTNANTYNGTATLNVNSTGAKDIARVGTTKTTRYYWSAGEVVGFVYDGTNYVMIERGIATTSYFGVTQLLTSAGSDSQSVASTPRSLYYLANNSIAPYYSSSNTYAVGDKVRYSYYLYECTTAITTPESWDADHWTELPTIQEQIDDKIWYGTEQQYNNLTDINPDVLYCIVES